MGNFNFSSIKETSFSGNSTQYLRPYDIYEVNLSKIERGEIKGTKDPSMVYPVITLEFKGVGDSKGIYTENLFIPTTEKDLERPSFTNDKGHEYQRPSRFENFQFTLMQIVHALNPSGEEKIKNNADKIKSIDQFIDLILKALNGKNNVNTYLKLVGRNSNGTIYSALPSACGLNKNNEIFATNFIGDKESLFFSNYEITQQKAYRDAKPTKMEDSVDDNPDIKSEDDLDLDGIDL